MANSLPDDVYEYLARVVAYDDYDRKDIPRSFRASNGKTYSFVINQVFDPWFSGFDAYGVTVSVEGYSESVLACRGTNSIVDILSDIQDKGVGYDQFTYNLDDVMDWCEDQLAAGRSISMTGHSLGGALAQWFGGYCSRKLHTTFNAVVTFNSPGIRQTMDSYVFDKGYIDRVCHYVNSGDVVSLAGDYFLDGDVKMYGSAYQCGVAGKNSISIGDYWSMQHTQTSYLIPDSDILPGRLGVYAIDSQVFSLSSFTYLLLSAPPELADETTWQLVSFGKTTYLFNSEFAESILALSRVYGDLDLEEANKYLTRDGVEEARQDKVAGLLFDYLTYDDDVNLNLTVQSSLACNGQQYLWLDCGTRFDDLLLDCNSLEFIQLSGTSKVSSPTVTFYINGSVGAINLRQEDDSLDIFASWTISWTAQSDDGCMTLANGTSAASSVQKSGFFAPAANGVADVLFTSVNGQWSDNHVIRHVGSLNGWTGTGDVVPLAGKNRLNDIVQGSEDANILYLTDDSNGDALIADDIYSTSYQNLGQSQSRLSQVDEVWAGGGDDLLDFTSQRFAYTGDLLILRGGDGDDVLWGPDCSSLLFGDAGDDQLVGNHGNDILSGGCGNDTLHGGGGRDVFCFGGDWGHDVVLQLPEGDVILWFQDDAGTWDSSSLTYTAQSGSSVQVLGVPLANITLRFGAVEGLEDTFSSLVYLGAFADYSTDTIFTASASSVIAANGTKLT